MRKLVVALATAGLAVTTLTAVPAGAAPKRPAKACTTTIDKKSVKLTPQPVVVPAKYWARQMVKLRINDSCLGVGDTVRVDVGYQTKDSETGGNSADANWDGDHWYAADIEVYFGADGLDNADAGWWHPDIFAYGSDEDEALPPLFSVLRETQLSTNATPEPVQKGRQLRVRGQLDRADLNAGKNVGYGKQKVELQYRTTKGSYHKIKTVTANSKGALDTKVKATRDGNYRYVFTGNSTSAAVTSGSDHVDVR